MKATRFCANLYQTLAHHFHQGGNFLSHRHENRQRRAGLSMVTVASKTWNVRSIFVYVIIFIAFRLSFLLEAIL
jgi:hypothetical protein